MNRGSLFRFLTDDHIRLAGPLEQSGLVPGKLTTSPMPSFRAGLLKHIAMAEKILLPAVRRLRGGEALPVADRLRRDHGALAALLVPTSTAAILAQIRVILADHNVVEEGLQDVYEECKNVAADEAESLLAEMRKLPDVKLAPHVDGPQVLESTRRDLERAGYRLEASG